MPQLLRREVTPYADLWKMVLGFKDRFQKWMYGPLYGFDLDDLETNVPAWTRLAARCVSGGWERLQGRAARCVEGVRQVFVRRFHRLAARCVGMGSGG